MENIQWENKISDGTLKKFKRKSWYIVLGAIFIFLIAFLSIYFDMYNDRSYSKNDNIFWILISVVAVITVAYMHYIYKPIKRFYHVNNEQIEITNLNNNKTKTYKWEELKSYSDDRSMFVDRNQYGQTFVDETEKIFYIRLKKKYNILRDYIFLEVEKDYVEKVLQILKEKLPEEKNIWPWQKNVK